VKKKAPLVGTLKVVWETFGKFAARATIDRYREPTIEKDGKEVPNPDPFPKPGKLQPGVKTSRNLYPLPEVEAWLRRRGVNLPEFDYS
jgi:hypothetical protein